MAESLAPPGGALPDVFRAEIDSITTNTRNENKIEMEGDPSCLEKSKTCTANCCDCFCQVRTDIQINANQTTYSGGGRDNGRILAVPYGGHGFQVRNGVQALAAASASLSASASPSVLGSVLLESSVQPMDSPPTYEALSYSWGSHDQSSRILINGQDFNVTQNLDDYAVDPWTIVRRDHNAALPLMRCHDGCHSISKGAPNAAESPCPHDMTGGVYKKFQQRHDANTCFAEGRMFAVLWHESAGRDHGGKHISGQHNFSNSGKIYSHNRRMVVVKGAEHGISWCVPVNTYQGSGVVKAGWNSSDIRAHSIVHLTAKSLTKTTDDASHTAHKPQPSPAKMSPDDDDDDESYGFRSASTRHFNCHPGIGSSQPDAWKAEIKKQDNQREQENQNRLGVYHLVLSEWRSVIARICGNYSGVIEQEWPEVWKDMSASILMTTDPTLGAAAVDLGPYEVVA